MSPEEFDQWENALASWRWDGVSLSDVVQRLHHYDNLSLRTDWSHTVPEGYRGIVSTIDSVNPLNSLQEIYHCIEILAVDQSGVALVSQWTEDGYLDVDYNERHMVMPLQEAQTRIDTSRETKRKQEAGEDEITEDWRLVGWNESLAI